MSRALAKVEKHYDNCSFFLIDSYQCCFIEIIDRNSDIFPLTSTVDITKSFRVLLNDEDLYLDRVEKNRWRVVSKKLDSLYKEDRRKIALKSGYYFNLYNKDNIPFFDELKKTDKIISIDNQKYSLYEAPNWELAQKIDILMGNQELGYEIDEYLVNKDINI